MNRPTWVLITILLLLITAQRLPAPIQEVPESPPPVPEQQADPRKTQSKSEAGESEPRTKSETKPSATPALQGPARFAGTWTGIVPFKNPFAGGGGDQQCDFIVNAEENSATIRVSKPGGGAFHTATTRLVVIGNTATGKGGFLKHMNVTLTLTGDGSTATMVVRDTIWGTTSGTVKKIR